MVVVVVVLVVVTCDVGTTLAVEYPEILSGGRALEKNPKFITVIFTENGMINTDTARNISVT